MLAQALIAGGGKGTRLGALARKYGNKSIVPIGGVPTISYTIAWLLEAGVRDIIITVNYMPEYRKIRALTKGERRIRVVTNPFRKTSAQCVAYSRHLLQRRFLFVYGHAPAPPSHLKKLMRSAGSGVAVSLYRSSTQGNLKPCTLHDKRVALNDRGKFYIEPPHILDAGLVRLLKNTKL